MEPGACVPEAKCLISGPAEDCAVVVTPGHTGDRIPVALQVEYLLTSLGVPNLDGPVDTREKVSALGIPGDALNPPCVSPQRPELLAR